MRHRSKIIKILILSFTLLLSYTAQASFVVKNIRVEGAQQIPASTVINYLPIHVGDTVDENNSGLILNIAANYGGRWDIIQSVKKIIRKVQE